MYELIFHKNAEKQFLKLPRNIQERIGKSLRRIQVRPHHFVKSLSGSKYYSLRIGNYRVVLDIQNKKLIIFVLELAHRKKVYKNKK